MDIIKLCTFLFGMLAVVIGAPAVRKSDCNDPNVFWDKVDKSCKHCIFCRQGDKRNMKCGNGIGGIVKCVLCAADHYQDIQHFGGTFCSLCTSCSNMNMIEEKNCTPMSNAQCGACLTGFAKDPMQPSSVGCTSCDHLPDHIEGCQQQSSTLKQTTKSVSQTTNSVSQSLSSTQSTTSLKHSSSQSTSLEPNVKDQEKNKNDYTGTDKAGDEIVMHGEDHVPVDTFVIVITMFVVCLMIYPAHNFLKRLGVKIPSTCGSSVKTVSVDSSEDNNNEKSSTTCQRSSSTSSTLDVIHEDANESDSGEESSLLKRPVIQRSWSAPAPGQVHINPVPNFVSYYKKPKNPAVPATAVKITDQQLIKQASIICKDQLLGDLSQDIQKKICMHLNPDHSASMVQNWNDLAHSLGISHTIILNFEQRMESVFTHMYCKYPDTTMTTFLDAVKKLERPDVVKTICKSIIKEHGSTKI